MTVVHRLREVRALGGFERIDPGGTMVRPALSATPDWLPALEVFGDGIFGSNLVLRGRMNGEISTGTVSGNIDVAVNGERLPGATVERDFFGSRAASAALAFSETWVQASHGQA